MSRIHYESNEKGTMSIYDLNHVTTFIGHT